MRIGRIDIRIRDVLSRQIEWSDAALQELRRRIYWKAKSEKAHRFWGIFVHVTRKETLEEAYRIAKRNGGVRSS